ncbi:MAG: DUF2889 domain-containing protein [Steroidobacteraceae bacterium]
MSGISDPSLAPRAVEERNPHFGTGALRRCIRLLAEDGRVRAGVEDAYHSFRLTLHHDGRCITRLEPGFVRFPLDTCASAGEPLQRLVGTRLDTSWRDLVTTENPRLHCTHLYDLTALAMAHALRGGERSYAVTVPDEVDEPVWSTVQRDGIEVLAWRTSRGTLVEPAPLAGKPLLKGFNLWAHSLLKGDELEAATVLHKGYFVSRARPWDVEAGAGKPIAHHVTMRGACHSYSEPRMSVAIRNKGHTLDTSDPATPLLEDLG